LNFGKREQKSRRLLREKKNSKLLAFRNRKQPLPGEIKEWRNQKGGGQTLKKKGKKTGRAYAHHGKERGEPETIGGKGKSRERHSFYGTQGAVGEKKQLMSRRKRERRECP